MRRLSMNRATGRAGFTLMEVLITIAFVSVGIVAVLSSVSVGVSAIDRGRRSTTALFLAEQRMEQIKGFALSKNPLQGWANVGAGSFPAEAYGTIAGYPDFRRTVTVTNSPGGAVNAKQVEVWVFYRLATPSASGAENAVTAATLLVSR